VKKLSSICKICNSNANYTYRTASENVQEMIGGADMYMPLCRECYNEKLKTKEGVMGSSDQSESTSGEVGGATDERLIDVEKLRENISQHSPQSLDPEPFPE